MPENESRIVLWRNTIQLFHEYRKVNFIGPFKKVGYDYVVDRYFQSRMGEERNPDIVASGESGWAVIELTTSGNSKKEALAKYEKIDPRDLPQYGLYGHDGEPDVISSRLSPVDDGPFCRMLVDKNILVDKVEKIRNDSIRTALIEVDGKDISRLPEIPISLLPEMKYKRDIRRGLIDIIMKLFEPGRNSVTLVEIVDEGLERIKNRIGPRDRTCISIFSVTRSEL